jgi:hypothetical protein
MTLKKHVDVDHVVIAKKFEEINNHVTRVLEKQLAKKDIIGPLMKYPNSWCKRSIKKDDVQQKKFLQDLDLGLLIVKIHLPIQFVKNMWLKIYFAMHLRPRVVLLQESSFHKKCCPIWWR